MKKYYYSHTTTIAKNRASCNIKYLHPVALVIARTARARNSSMNTQVCVCVYLSCFLMHCLAGNTPPPPPLTAWAMAGSMILAAWWETYSWLLDSVDLYIQMLIKLP